MSWNGDDERNREICAEKGHYRVHDRCYRCGVALPETSYEEHLLHRIKELEAKNGGKP